MNWKAMLRTAALASFLMSSWGLKPASASNVDPVVINEVLASHTGTDNTEYVEFYGGPNTSLHGLSLIVVESDAGSSTGRIDRRFDFKPFHELGSNGFFLLGNCEGLSLNYEVNPDSAINSNYLENSSMTLALVETLSLSGDVGDFVSGSEIVIDTVGLFDGGTGDTFFFGAPVIGPDGPFFPAGARRLVDGGDTDTPGDWVISDFFLGTDNTPVSGGWSGCAPPVLTISTIQGGGTVSLFENEEVTTTGVVTQYTANGRDFWLQDVIGDGNPATSDGIIVDDGGLFPGAPAVGDLVSITAVVDEQQFIPALPLTRLDSPSDITILSAGNPLPAPIEISDMPDEVIADGIDVWEPLEGMLVSVPDARVVAPTNRFGEFSVLTPADAIPGSGFNPETKQIHIRNLGADSVDYNPERIMVDDSALIAPVQVKPGDRVPALVGVVDYSFGNYKIQPNTLNVESGLAGQSTVRSGSDGNTVITTFDLGDLFDLVDNPKKEDELSTPTPAELETKLSKLSLAIENELRIPQIIVVQKVENTTILQDLGDRVNTSAGTNYMATSFESSDIRGLEVGFLWDADRVSLVNAYQMSGADVEAAFGPSSPSPGREPAVGVFSIGGSEITVIGIHFTSKGPDDPLYGVHNPPDRISEIQRKDQARVVRSRAVDLLNLDSEALFLVAGILNDFQFSEPGEGVDNPSGIIEGIEGGERLVNLTITEQDVDVFNFIFDGNSEVLDHMWLSPGLYGMMQGWDILHFNASFPASLGDMADSPLRASDRDPIELKLRLPLHHEGK